MSRTRDGTKHTEFVSEPMKFKEVIKIPGIGTVLSGKFNTKEYILAYQVLGQFLMLRDQEGEFQKWFKRTADTERNHYGNDCSKGLEEWCQKHFDRAIPATDEEEGDRKFVDEPMGEKPVSEIPGMDELRYNDGEIEYHKAYQVFGKFLMLKKDEIKFQEWLKRHFIDEESKAKACCDSMVEWCERQFDKPPAKDDACRPPTDDKKDGKFHDEPMGEEAGRSISPNEDGENMKFDNETMGEEAGRSIPPNEDREDMKLDNEPMGEEAGRSIPPNEDGENRKFVDELMGEKPVSEIPGMDGLSCKDGEIEYHKAYQLFGMFLMLKKKKEDFQKWLEENLKASPEQAKCCSADMKKWCKKYFDGLIMPKRDEKFKKFVREPMGAKKISDIPGLDEDCKTDDYYMAYHVFAKFLLLNMDEDRFKDWLKDDFNAGKQQVDDQQAVDCSAGMAEWCERNFY